MSMLLIVSIMININCTFTI